MLSKPSDDIPSGRTCPRAVPQCQNWIKGCKVTAQHTFPHARSAPVNGLFSVSSHALNGGSYTEAKKESFSHSPKARWMQQRTLPHFKNDLKSCGVKIHGGCTAMTTEHFSNGSLFSKKNVSMFDGGGVLRHTSVLHTPASPSLRFTYVTSHLAASCGKAACSARVAVCSGSARTQGVTSWTLVGRGMAGVVVMSNPGAGTVNAYPVRSSTVGASSFSLGKDSKTIQMRGSHVSRVLYEKNKYTHTRQYSFIKHPLRLWCHDICESGAVVFRLDCQVVEMRFMSVGRHGRRCGAVDHQRKHGLCEIESEVVRRGERFVMWLWGKHSFQGST
jgi:hypothetical protein